jgi:hypothetical protein
MIWLISGKGQPWTNPAESDLILRDLWNAFPPDITPEEIGLPIAISAPPLDNTNIRPRKNRGPRSELVSSLLEEDIADQTNRHCISTSL